jgi:hypothetical protein
MTMPDDLSIRLAAMPALLRRVAAALTDAAARTPGPDGGFAFVEHAWHLADLEREGYRARITRIPLGAPAAVRDAIRAHAAGAPGRGARGSRAA